MKKSTSRPTHKFFSLSPGVYEETARNFRIRFGRVELPVGAGYLAETSGRIVALSLSTDRQEFEQWLSRDWRNARLEEDKVGIAAMAERLLNTPSPLVEVLLKGTEFQVRVWKALCQIPSGETWAYAQLASAIGQPKAVRATAGAVAANPIAWLIPCHRVIRSDGTLGGYAYGLEAKQKLLAAEGVHCATA